jgi:hypothetical protein
MGDVTLSIEHKAEHLGVLPFHGVYTSYDYRKFATV